MESFNIDDPEKYVEDLLAKTDPLANQPNAKKRKASASKDTVVLNYTSVPTDIRDAVDKIRKFQDWQNEKTVKEKTYNQGLKSEKKKIQEFLVKQGDEALIEHNGYAYRTMVSTAQERLSDKMLLKAYQDMKTEHPELASAAALYYIYIQKRRMKTKKSVKLSIRKTKSTDPEIPTKTVVNTVTKPLAKKQKIDHPVKTPTSSNTTKSIKPRTPNTTGQDDSLPEFYDTESYSQYYRQH